MVAHNAKTIRFRARQFGYEDACLLARRVAACPRWPVVYVLLEQTTQTSTAALARLILLRRDLLARGGDLGIIGLKGKAKALHEISRLDNLLPLLPGRQA